MEILALQKAQAKVQKDQAAALKDEKKARKRRDKRILASLRTLHQAVKSLLPASQMSRDDLDSWLYERDLMLLTVDYPEDVVPPDPSDTDNYEWPLVAAKGRVVARKRPSQTDHMPRCMRHVQECCRKFEALRELNFVDALQVPFSCGGVNGKLDCGLTHLKPKYADDVSCFSALIEVISPAAFESEKGHVIAQGCIQLLAANVDAAKPVPVLVTDGSNGILLCLRRRSMQGISTSSKVLRREKLKLISIACNRKLPMAGGNSCDLRSWNIASLSMRQWLSLHLILWRRGP